MKIARIMSWLFFVTGIVCGAASLVALFNDWPDLGIPLLVGGMACCVAFSCCESIGWPQEKP